MSRAEPTKRGSRTAGGCLHHPHTSQKFRGTPYMVLLSQQAWKLAFSRAHTYLLGTCWDGGGKERDHKDGDVGSGFSHTKGV